MYSATALGPVPSIDFVGDGAQRGAAPFDRDADLARVEQIVVVFRVADADGVVNRDPQREQRLTEACGLADRLRQHHQAAAIERENQRLLERSDHLEDRRRPIARRPRRRIRRPRRGCWRRRSSSRNAAFGGWPITTWRPLAGNSSTAPFSATIDVEAGEIAGDLPQIGQPAAGHEHHDDPGLPGVADRVAHVGIERAVDGDGAVVVECDGRELHRTT